MHFFLKSNPHLVGVTQCDDHNLAHRPRNHQQQQQQQQRDNPEDGGGAGGVNSSSFFRSKSSKRDEPVENHSWSFLLSLPHLIMVSNLQNLFGARGGKKPSIQPNDYMDNVIASMKTDMKERYGQEHAQLKVEYRHFYVC